MIEEERKKKEEEKNDVRNKEEEKEIKEEEPRVHTKEIDPSLPFLPDPSLRGKPECGNVRLTLETPHSGTADWECLPKHGTVTRIPVN